MLANGGWDLIQRLTLILLTWTKWRAPANASKRRMGFNSAFKGLILKRSKLTDKPIPVAVRSTVWVCNGLMDGFVGSNPAQAMDVCLLCSLCV